MDLQNLWFILTTFFFLFVLINLVIKKSTSSNKTKLPPGPWKLPLIGNIQPLVGPLPHETLRNLASKYGPLMYVKLGEVSNIIISSTEMAQEIMKTQDLNFCDRPRDSLVSRIIAYDGRGFSFSDYGDHWRQLRKICTTELLTTKRVQSFRFIREEEVSEMVKSISESEGSIVNLTNKILSLTYGITAKTAFGKSHSYQQQKAFVSAMEKLLLLVGEKSLAKLYPSVKVFQVLSKTKARMEELHKKTDKILQDIIDDHKNNKKEGEEVVEDLVDVLLKFQKEDSEFPLDDESIKAVVQDMFVAGSETSSAVVDWAMAEMIKKPKVMKAAQSEVRKVYGNKGYVDESELHQLTYLKCVIKETLRLHPSLPLAPRSTRETCQIMGYHIPANCNILINVWAIGRDPRYWVDAENFMPERFLDSSIDYRGTNFELIPFGGGRRMCPGIAFATPNMELPLAKLLYHFDWKFPHGMNNEELDMTELFGMTVRRKNDLCLIPITTHQP
ncbi:hypothetical protein PIB30_037820 [Stylosanthes scabra]|uniref:Cytochrome P450 n=1 Tax=Stylosanthes scabra TaxID=79078 RepID=A0ABU6RDW4_9FABA|nr:hypothetical protein [Stylosanthes scabra]